MANKNFLIGYGETLTRKIEVKKGGGPKSHPYSLPEAQARISKQVKKVVRSINNITEDACPHGEVVTKITLHPAYMSKSYYPETLLRSFGLRDVGSKAIAIAPEKWGKTRHPEKEVTSCLFIAGSKHAFEAWNHALNEELPNSVLKDVQKIENVSSFEANEKIKTLKKLPGGKVNLEVALHAGEDQQYIVSAFISYAEKLKGLVDIDRIKRVGGLTFLPVILPYNKTSSLAEFTYLRVLRSMPSLRLNKPTATRTTLSIKPILPTENAINQSTKVAIFDGGIGNNTLIDQWTTETTFGKNGSKSHPDLLAHGGDVTSTYLFGPVDKTNPTLSRPYTNVDHYRVLDPSTTVNSDLFDVLDRIETVLKGGAYKFINLSLGPQLPIEDDEVHVWTSTLDKYLQNGDMLATVAVGNDGDLDNELARIQPPSDMVNCIAVGAANSQTEEWSRATYSCRGPGRSPGIIKPDGVAFGGDKNNLFPVYSPLTNKIVETAGTSFSSPLVLRTAVGLDISLNYELTPMAIKALLVHHAKNGGNSQEDVGWGRFPQTISELALCEDYEATVIYQGFLTQSEYLRAAIQFPDIEINKHVNIKATFCFSAATDPEHPVHYTRSGLEITFRPHHKKFKDKKQEHPKSKPFFKLNEMYLTEQELRSDANKWETCISKEKGFNPKSLSDPCFDIYYHTRQQGKAADADWPRLPYALVITVSSKDTPGIYNNILQRYQTLQPIRTKTRVKIR